MKTVLLFTHSDLDGIGCDIVARKYFSNYPDKYTLKTFFCDYSNVDEIVLDTISSIETTPDIIYITDISVTDKTAEILDKYAKDNNIVLKLLDHHPTALRLNTYEWADVVINITPNKKACGTFLLFKELYIDPSYASKTMLEFVELVRLYDTYEFETNTVYGDRPKRLNYLFQNMLRDKFIVDIIDYYLDDSVYNVFPEFTECDKEIVDRAIQREEDAYESAKKSLTVRYFSSHNSGWYFGNAYVSAVCNRLCKENPDLDFVCCINTNRLTFEFRTIRDDLDLGKEIAPLFGGGGHPKAAGAQINQDQVKHMINALIN
jgi:oligoribonuclease NrnB/cAMP/cGMP phosphodiesterase (DHH superfamily)